MATHFQQLKIKEIRPETNDCLSILFEVPAHLAESFAFTQGQNITVRATLDGVELRRSYSICSSPLDNELRVAVKRMEPGRFSGWAHRQLKPGDILEVLPPSGKFFTRLDPASEKNYVAFAAGSGITPILSIIKTTLVTEPKSSFTLVYGNRNRASIIFKEELEALKNKYIQRFRLIHVLSRERTDAEINFGRIDRAKCEVLFRTVIDLNGSDEFFICGPEEMIRAVSGYLEEQQVPRAKVHYELFSTPGQPVFAPSSRAEKPVADPDALSQVTVKLDGISFQFPLAYQSDTILEAALNEGADLPYACKGGVCATCRAKLVSGEVEMENNYALEPEELASGFILTCQSHPRTAEVMIDFDMK